MKISELIERLERIKTYCPNADVFLFDPDLNDWDTIGSIDYDSGLEEVRLFPKEDD